MSTNLRAAVLSVVLFGTFLFIWQIWVSAQTGVADNVDSDYAALLGQQAKGGSAMPGPLEVDRTIWAHFADPFYDKGPNDKGIGIQLAYSILRVMTGFLLAAAVAVPLSFFIGMCEVFRKAVDPFVQVLKPVSPLAWMPLALYTIRIAAPRRSSSSSSAQSGRC